MVMQRIDMYKWMMKGTTEESIRDLQYDTLSGWFCCTSRSGTHVGGGICIVPVVPKVSVKVITSSREYLLL